MNRDSAVAFGVGLACIALVVGGIVFMQRGDRIELPGKILKVRTAPLDENSAVAVIDFRINNPSGVQFMVRTVQVKMDDNEGKSYLGFIFARAGTAAEKKDLAATIFPRCKACRKMFSRVP